MVAGGELAQAGAHRRLVPAHELAEGVAVVLDQDTGNKLCIADLGRRHGRRPDACLIRRYSTCPARCLPACRWSGPGGDPRATTAPGSPPPRTAGSVRPS